MPRVESGGVHAEWDPADGILRMRMAPGCRPTAEDAHRIADAVEAWTGHTEPMDAIIDCEGATGLHVGWRVAWTMRITKHKREVRLAYHDLGQLAAWVIPHFARLSGIEARRFANAAEAEAWLRDARAAAEGLDERASGSS